LSFFRSNLALFDVVLELNFDTHLIRPGRSFACQCLLGFVSKFVGSLCDFVPVDLNVALVGCYLEQDYGPADADGNNTTDFHGQKASGPEKTTIT